MGKAVKGFVMFAIALAILMIILTISGRALRQSENTDALADAIETSLKNVMQQKAYTINNSDEFVADFLETLLVQYNSDSKITVKILKQDMEKGLLSVEVDEEYTHPNGNTGTVSVVRTVIFDRSIKQDEIYHTINFWVNGEKYKSYSILEGNALIDPKEPEEEDQEFLYWMNKADDSQVDISDLTADKDYNFSAKFMAQ